MPKTKASKPPPRPPPRKEPAKKAQAKKRATPTPKAKKAASTAKKAPQRKLRRPKKTPARAAKAAVAKKAPAKKEGKRPKRSSGEQVSGQHNQEKSKVTTKELAKTVDKSIEPHALNDDVTEKVRELIHLSREQGYLTFKDIDNSLPEIANQPEELQSVISIFNNLEIKLLDSKEVDKFKKNKEENEEETARSNQSDMLDDPVRMYLKQMGQVPF